VSRFAFRTGPIEKGMAKSSTGCYQCKATLANWSV
jgi:hypothetical protein